MSDQINEALLEMHFHRALVRHFSRRFGAGFLKLLKPSQQQEAWVGFDQGWHHSSVSNEELLNELKDAIHSNRTQTNNFYLGYFMQFKKVLKMRSKGNTHRPPSFRSFFYRSTLSTIPNKKTGISQHETLLRLQRVSNASVSYACPMLFEIDDIYKNPDINKLRLISLSNAPSNWQPYDKHYICFQTINGQPVWLSEPVQGKAYSVEEWASDTLGVGPKKLFGDQIIELIRNTLKVNFFKTGSNYFEKEDGRFIKYLPESMTIIKFKRKDL